MEIGKCVIYKGRKYRIQSSGKYYQDQNKKGKTERLLHRAVWVEHCGTIPDGMCVHHKDGDWTNNHIDNLEIMPISDHARLHVQQRYKQHP